MTGFQPCYQQNDLATSRFSLSTYLPLFRLFGNTLALISPLIPALRHHIISGNLDIFFQSPPNDQTHHHHLISEIYTSAALNFFCLLFPRSIAPIPHIPFAIQDPRWPLMDPHILSHCHISIPHQFLHDIHIASSSSSLHPMPIVLGAHLGVWELLVPTLATLLHLDPSKVTIVYKPAHGPIAQRILSSSRQSNPLLELIPDKGSFDTLLHRMTHDRCMIGMLSDQRASGHSRRSISNIQFLGDDTCPLASGWAHLALQTGAPVYLATLLRTYDSTSGALKAKKLFELRVECLSNRSFSSSNDEDSLRALVQKYAARVTEMVREHPGQYYWLHDMFKKFKKPKKKTQEHAETMI